MARARRRARAAPPAARRRRAQTPADAGQALPAPDLVATPTELVAFEPPWDGHRRRRRAAGLCRRLLGLGAAGPARRCMPSRRASWCRSARAASRRSVIGQTVDRAAAFARAAARSRRRRSTSSSSRPISCSPSATPKRSPTAPIARCSAARCCSSPRRSRSAERTWRLRGLLRGRGGTEAAAQAGHAGRRAVRAARRPADRARSGQARRGATSVAAIGLADSEPVSAPILNPGLGLASAGAGASAQPRDRGRRPRPRMDPPRARGVDLARRDRDAAERAGRGATSSASATPTSPDLRWQLGAAAARAVGRAAGRSSRPRMPASRCGCARSAASPSPIRCC